MDVKKGDDTFNIPDGLLYSKLHFWVKADGDSVTVGVSDFGQKQLGDISLVSLDGEGSTVKQSVDDSGSSVDGLSIESSKAVQDVYAPVSGTITSLNKALEDAPEKINTDCYGDGWVLKIKASNLGGEKGNLMNAAAYAAYIKTL
jgi:glycine cleavage system H protein